MIKLFIIGLIGFCLIKLLVFYCMSGLNQYKNKELKARESKDILIKKLDTAYNENKLNKKTISLIISFLRKNNIIIINDWSCINDYDIVIKTLENNRISLDKINYISKIVSNLDNNYINNAHLEEAYSKVWNRFNYLIKTRRINETNILLIKNYLENNKIPSNSKKYNNDIHMIYSSLKSKKMTTSMFNDIYKILNI